MKRTLLVFAAMAALLVTSCSKNESVETPVPNDGKNFVVYIDNGGSQQAPGKKGTFTPQTVINGTNVIWDQGDEITVNGQTFSTETGGANGVTFTGVTAVNAPYKAFYGAGSSITLNQNGELATFSPNQTYAPGKIMVPMYAESQNNTLTFHNLTAVFKITIPASCTTGVQQIKVQANQPMTGNAAIAMNGNKPYLNITQTGAGYNEITFGASEAISAGTTVYIPVPQGNYTNLKVYFGTELFRDLGSRNVVANKIYSIQSQDEANLLPGVFSVSATKRVRFTKGNLTGTTGNYSFATSQTDAGGDYTLPNPWSSSTVVSGASGYELLSKDEFQYLLGINVTGRTMINGAPRYNIAKIGTGYFLVIYPDNYTNTNPPSSYTTAQMATAEQAGCVFMAIPEVSTATFKVQYLTSTKYNGSYPYNLLISFFDDGTGIENPWVDIDFDQPDNTFKIRLVKVVP